jgi:RNA polymerase sigma-70 factor (ECF subfamily)
VTDEEELMTALYTEHYGVLLGFISRYVRDRHRAEDLVQETLLRAWRHIDRIDVGQNTTRAYLLTIARNVVTSAWHADRRRPHLVEGEELIAAVPTSDSVDEMVDGWLVTAALERLSEDHRAVVHSMYYEGRTVAETAHRLELPEGTVKSRAYYAVRALRATFEEMGVLR